MRILFGLVLFLGVAASLEAANAAPVVSAGASGLSRSTSEHQSVVLLPDATITDADAGDQIQQLVVTISSSVSGDALTHGSQTGITATPGTGTVTFSGNADRAAYQALLRTVSFRPDGDNPGTSRSITVRVKDTGSPAAESAVVTVTVAITQQNDPPVFSPTSASRSTSEDQAVTLWSSVSITDPDSSNMASLTVSVPTPVAGDTFLYTGQAGITVATTNGGLTATGSASIGAYQSLLRSISFTPGGPVPGTTRTINATIVDHTATPSSQLSATVTITPIDDPPVISNGSGSTTVVEDGVVTLFGSATIADPDSAQLTALEVTIDSELVGDWLDYTPDGALVFTRQSDGDLLITGTAALATYQAVLRNITFSPRGDNPGTQRVLHARVKDATSFGAEVTVTASITGVNDAPTVLATPLATAQTDEEQPLTLSFSQLSNGAADPDGTSPSIRLVSVATGTLQPAGGGANLLPGAILSSGQSWRWTPAVDAVSESASLAFTIEAWDGALASGPREVHVPVKHVADLQRFSADATYYLNSGRQRVAALGDQMAFHANDAPVIVPNGAKLVATLRKLPGLTILEEEDALYVVSNTAASLTVGSGRKLLRAGTEIATYVWDQGPATLTLTFNAAAQVADIENASRCIAYDNTFGETGTIGQRRVTLQFLESGRPASNSREKLLEVLAPNQPPEIVLGTDANPPRQLVVDPGGTVVLSPQHLLATDDQSTGTDLVFTVMNIPAYGRLRLTVAGVTTILGSGQNFTQDDVGAGRVSYLHFGGTIPSDSVALQVADRPTGGLVSQQRSLLVQVGVARDVAIISDPILTVRQGKPFSHLIRVVGGTGAQSMTATVHLASGPDIVLGESTGSWTWEHTFGTLGIEPVEVRVDTGFSVLIQPMRIAVVAPLTAGG